MKFRTSSAFAFLIGYYCLFEILTGIIFSNLYGIFYAEIGLTIALLFGFLGGYSNKKRKQDKLIKVRFQTWKGCQHVTFNNIQELEIYIRHNKGNILAFQIEK